MKISIKSLSLTFICAASICLAMTSCNDKNEPDDKPGNSTSRSIELSEAEKTVSLQSNQFAWQLLDKCIKANAGNVVISPLSASICLSMLANATAGDSQSQLVNALGFNDMKTEDINSFNNKLSHEIQALDDNVKVSLANSLWYDVNLNPKKDFIQYLNTNYQIQTSPINHATFSKDVNAWCNQYTQGLIPRIIDDGVDKDFALINALYFKGIWPSHYKFDKSLTIRDDFRNADGAKSIVEYMCDKTQYNYHCAETWRAMSIPFGGGGYIFTVVLPDDGYTVDQCLESIKEFDPATGKYDLRLLELRLPKFKMKQDTDLINVLKQLGVKDIFNTELCDLSNFTDTPMVIDLVKQSVSFEINEEGAEAAAVTITGGVATAAGPVVDGYELFYVDHPFIFMISERSTGAILFVGRINKF